MNEESVHFATELSDEKTSLTIVDRIATLEATDPIELPPLYDVVDPDALDSFVQSSDARSSGSASEIRFAYCGYDIRVRSDGEIGISAA